MREILFRGKRICMADYDKIFKGFLVRFVDEEKHKMFPNYYPEPGTVGKVTFAYENALQVQWPKGSTSLNDWWGCSSDYVIPVCDDADDDQDDDVEVDVLSTLFGKENT